MLIFLRDFLYLQFLLYYNSRQLYEQLNTFQPVITFCDKLQFILNIFQGLYCGEIYKIRYTK
jgi:hypothetical protein